MIMMAFAFLSHFCRTSIAVAGHAKIMDEYSISEIDWGMVASALLLPYTLLMIPAGMFCDWLGARKTLCLVGIGVAELTAFTGMCGEPYLSGQELIVALVIVRGLLGVFMAPTFPAMGKIVQAWIPFRRRALANAITTGSVPVGVAATYFVFRWMVDGPGWQIAYYVTSAVCGVVALAWILYGKDRPEQHPRVNAEELRLIRGGEGAEPTASPPTKRRRVSPRDWLSLIMSRNVWLLSATYFAIGYFEYLLFYWSSRYFEKILEMDKEDAIRNSALLPLAMAVGQLVSGWVCDRLVEIVGHRWARGSVAILGLVGAAFFLAAGTLVENQTLIVVFLALSMAAIGMCEGAAWVCAIEVGGRCAASSAAIINCFGNLGGTIAPVLTPWVAAMYIEMEYETADAWGNAIRIASVLCLVGTVFWFWIDSSKPAVKDEPEA